MPSLLLVIRRRETAWAVRSPGQSRVRRETGKE